MREPTIPISRDHGINPSIEICPMCGKETGNIILLGRCNKYICQDCRKFIYSSALPKCCPCGSSRVKLKEVDVKAPMRIPGRICEDCKKTLEEQGAMVRQGGVYFKCRKCGTTGVIRPGHIISLLTRHKMGICAPKPCGIELEDCPKCREE
jgi:hypothetical protein